MVGKLRVSMKFLPIIYCCVIKILPKLRSLKYQLFYCILCGSTQIGLNWPITLLHAAPTRATWYSQASGLAYRLQSVFTNICTLMGMAARLGWPRPLALSNWPRAYWFFVQCPKMTGDWWWKLHFHKGPKLPACHWCHSLLVRELPGQPRLKKRETDIAGHHVWWEACL